MSYKLTREKLVRRLFDGATLPCRYENGQATPLDEHSPIIQAFLKWLADGNVPEPADPAPQPIDYSDSDNLDKTLKALALTVCQITGATPQQFKTIFKNKFDALP